MKYRIREENMGYRSSFYIERWHELRNEWVAALVCSFDSFEEAQEGIDFWHHSHSGLENSSTIFYDYIPRKMKC